MIFPPDFVGRALAYSFLSPPEGGLDLVTNRKGASYSVKARGVSDQDWSKRQSKGVDTLGQSVNLSNSQPQLESNGRTRRRRWSKDNRAGAYE